MFKRLAVISVPIFIAFIIVLAFLNPTLVFEPPFLLPALNVLFLSLLPFTVAYLAWKSYCASGAFTLVFTGCGMVAFGFGSLIAGFIINIPGGTNLTPTIHNTGAFLGSILLVTAALFAFQKATPDKTPKHGGLYLGLCYLAILVFISVFSLTALAGSIPPFFVQGAGPTVLRQVVLGTATTLFAAATIIFLRVYFRSRSDFAYWFSLALVLITIGLCAIFIQKGVGTLEGWAGRAAQYMGCAYLLVGIISTVRLSEEKHVPLEQEISRAFSIIETNYKTLIEMASDAIISIDNKGTILTWNPAASKIFGYSVSEATGTNIIDFILPRGSALLLNSELQKPAQARGPAAEPGSKLETMARRKQGEDLPVEVSMSMKKVAGEWLGTLLIRDITERKQAEEAIHHLATYPQLTPIMVMEFNRTEDVLFSNPSVQSALTTWSIAHPSQFIPQNWKEILAGPGSIEETIDVQEIMIGGRFIEEHIHFIKESQTLRIYAENITDRKKAEMALQESEEKYRLLAENSRDIIWTMDMNLKFTYMSPAVLTIRGYTVEEVMAQSVDEIFTPSSLQIALKAFEEEFALESVEPKNLSRTRTLELEHIRKDGSTVWVDINILFLRDIEGHPIGILGVSRDITERRQAGEALRESEQLYRSLFDNMLNGFAYCKMIFEQGQPRDLIYLSVNSAFEKHTGLKNVIGKKITEVLPGIYEADPHLFEVYGRVALTGIPEKFETYVSSMGMWFSISVYCPQKEYFVAVFDVITERKMAEEKLMKSYESLKKTLNDAINIMIKIMETRDPYTAGHQQKVADLAIAIAREMKLEDTRIDQLRTAAIIHDIGKMYIPSDILSKPGKLSDIEFNLIKTHAKAGYDIVKGMDFPCNVAKAVLQHHERLDGSGYPNHLKGEDTLLEAKILAVADVIEAMASHRPYRPALGIDKALEEVSKNKGKLYDPGVVDTCLDLFNSGKFEFKAV